MNKNSTCAWRLDGFASLAMTGLSIILTTAAPALAASSANPGGEALLHRLGADPLQLRFEGETSAKSWPIYVTADEARTRARIHLGFTNAISVMPETSILSISVNDIAVAQTPIAAGADPGALDVELPKELLTPGYNEVRVAVLQRHRVDCSMEATYELWTQLDPASSGLTFPGLADPHVETLDDLAATSPDASGATTIRVALPADPDAGALDDALRAAEAVAIRAGVQRPRVEFVDDIGERPGLYVLAGQRSYLSDHGFARYLPTQDGRVLALAGQETPGRVIVIAVGDSREEIAEAIGGILPAGRSAPRAETPAAVRALTNQFGYPATTSLRAPLRDLGVTTQEFSGRLYRAAFDINLPDDFYAADYDKLTLSLTAGYAEGLLPSAQILVRVNDREAGSMPMKNPHGAVFRDRPVSVSLSALRPGLNHIIVEAQTPDAGDKACDVPHLMESRKRFVLFENSELILPPFARIGRFPNLAATLSSGFPYQNAADSFVYVAARDRLTLSAVGTYLARTAVVAGKPVAARVTFDREAVQQGSALFIGALADLTPGLIETFGVDYRALKETWSRPAALRAPANEVGGAPAPTSPESAQVFDQWAEGEHATPVKFSTVASLGAIYDRYINIHRSDFALLREPDRKVVAPQRATIVLAQAQGPRGGSDAWTLVVGPDPATLARDMPNLVAPSNWSEVEGRAAVFTPRTGAKTIAQASNTFFIPTESLTPSNIRLIAAGFLSTNLDDYALIVLIAAAVLGLATHAVVKSHGNRS